MSNSSRPHEPQYSRPPCPSPTARVYPNPCPSSQWCHPSISSSATLFSCTQSFPASGSFPMSLLFASSGQSIGASASASILNLITSLSTAVLGSCKCHDLFFIYLFIFCHDLIFWPHKAVPNWSDNIHKLRQNIGCPAQSWAPVPWRSALQRHKYTQHYRVVHLGLRW